MQIYPCSSSIRRGKVLYDTLFLAMLLLAFSIQQPTSIAAAYVLCAIYVFIGPNKIGITQTHLTAFAIGSVPCLLAALSFNHGITPVFYLSVLPLVILAANVFAGRSHGHVVECLKNVHWMFVVGIAIGLAMHWDDPEPLGAIFPGSSTNGLPSYLIVVQIAFSIAHFLKNGRLPLLSAIATFAVAVFGLGRGSMIVAALILIFGIMINVMTSENKSDRKVFFTTVCLFSLPISLYFYANFDDLMASVELLIEGSKFSSGVLDEHRGRIIDDYLNKIDAWSLIFGAAYDGTSIVLNYGGNPHNSFIRVHSFYGLAGLLFVASSLLLIMASNRHRIHKRVTLVLVVLALIRATSEPIFFPSTLDFFYFLYFFLYFNFSRRKSCAYARNA